MAVATKKRRTKNSAGGTPPSVKLTIVESRTLDPAGIALNPWQPRSYFEDESIRQLAESMKAGGQLQTILVRRVTEGPQAFQLLCGERRLRAARIAGVEVRAEICECTDRDARSIALAENIHRQDLSAIELARSYQMMLDCGDAAGPTELAEQLGLAQSTVSNRLRLLELPVLWQQKVISREITERHARVVLVYKDHPAVMDGLEEALAEETDDRGGVPGVTEWENSIVPLVVTNNSRPMDGTNGDGTIYDQQRGRVAIFVPTQDQQDELDIVESGGSRRALNVELWERLQAEHLGSEASAADSADQGESPEVVVTADTDENDGVDRDVPRGAESHNDTAGGDEQNTDSIRSRLDAFTRRPEFGNEPTHVKTFVFNIIDGKEKLVSKNIDRALSLLEGNDASGHGKEATGKDFASRLWAWKVMAMRKAIADYLLGRAEDSELIRLASLALTRWSSTSDESNLGNALRFAGAKKIKNLCEATFSVGTWDSSKVLARLVADCFWSESEGPMFGAPAEDVVVVADFLYIDLVSEWDGGTIASPQGYWDLHAKEQLLAIAKEGHFQRFLPADDDGIRWSLEDFSKKSRHTMIELLMKAMPVSDSNMVGIPMPEEIAKAKQPKK
jgi:ParB/RepB/Spo0J family partition protein